MIAVVAEVLADSVGSVVGVSCFSAVGSVVLVAGCVFSVGLVVGVSCFSAVVFCGSEGVVWEEFSCWVFFGSVDSVPEVEVVVAVFVSGAFTGAVGFVVVGFAAGFVVVGAVAGFVVVVPDVVVGFVGGVFVVVVVGFVFVVGFVVVTVVVLGSGFLVGT